MMSEGIKNFLIGTTIIGMIPAAIALSLGIGLMLIDGFGISDYPTSMLNRYLCGGGLLYLWIYFGGYYLGTQPPEKKSEP